MNSNLKAQEWQDFSMRNDTCIFHKMCKVDNYYWAIEFGNGEIYHSKDSGENWELQYTTEGEFMEAIQFLNKEVGFVCGDYGIIMKTNDGGNTWQEIGPKYASRITKTNPLEDDPDALGRYYYQMFFKNEEEGLVWDFEVLPQKTGWKDYKNYFYQTKDGGKSWSKIEYKKEEYDEILVDFLKGVKLQNEMAMEIYYANNKTYKTGRAGREGIKIWSDDGQSLVSYPLPQFPDKRYILRSIHFISDHQGYLFGGNLEEKSRGYIYETLDGGQSWRSLETDLPHIHYGLQTGNEILLSGKDGLLKKWTPPIKEAKSFIHKGNASTTLIDGQIEEKE